MANRLMYFNTGAKKTNQQAQKALNAMSDNLAKLARAAGKSKGSAVPDSIPMDLSMNRRVLESGCGGFVGCVCFSESTTLWWRSQGLPETIIGV